MKGQGFEVEGNAETLQGFESMAKVIQIVFSDL